MKAGSNRDIGHNESPQTDGGWHQAVYSTWQAEVKLMQSLLGSAPD